MENEKNI